MRTTEAAEFLIDKINRSKSNQDLLGSMAK
jgi:transcription termination factor Rho